MTIEEKVKIIKEYRSLTADDDTYFDIALDVAVEALEELQAHREAWGKITAEIQDRSFENPMMNPIFTMNEIYEIIDKYRPKEGDNNDKGKSHIPS